MYDHLQCRDDPGQGGSFIVSNNPGTGCELRLLAQNIFAAIRLGVKLLMCNNYVQLGAVFTASCQIEDTLMSRSTSPNQKKLLQRLDNQLQTKMMELGLTSMDTKTLVKQRNKEIVAKCFHKIGIVVPCDKQTDVGYRSLPKTDSMLIPAMVHYSIDVFTANFILTCVCRRTDETT